ncbi:MAG TPA: hypothetical protein H9730_08810 [Candidatus Mediterraneibacter stercoripullorum]|nr:hypothetical protein [Candidatus Mediterraneibacter stercoripullorum]
MQLIKRVLAFAGVIILICMYGSTLIFALMGSSRSTDLLMASVIATVIVPVLLYAFTLVTRLLNNHNTDSDGRSFGSSDTPSDK